MGAVPQDDYSRTFTVNYVHDGDTIMGRLDLGFSIGVDWAIRFAGINALELGDPGGIEARDHLKTLVAPGDVLPIRSVKYDKYSKRVDAMVYLPDGTNLNKLLVEENWAAWYDGRGKTSEHVPPWPRP